MHDGCGLRVYVVLYMRVEGDRLCIWYKRRKGWSLVYGKGLLEP